MSTTTTERRAIREPMAEPTPEPEPSQAPAGDGGLVDTISDIIENEPIIGRPPEEKWKPEARAVILAVAKWLRSVGNHGSAADLEREAQPMTHPTPTTTPLPAEPSWALYDYGFQHGLAAGRAELDGGAPQPTSTETF